MSTKTPTARVQVAAAIWDAVAPNVTVPGTFEVERRTVGHGTSVIVEGTAQGLHKLADRIARLKGVPKAERDRVSERVLAAMNAIESGEATTAAQARERVAAKVAKLLEHARSAQAVGNAEEAATFAAKVDELLVKFELGMTDLEYAAVQEADPIGRVRVNMAKHDEATPVLDGKPWRPKLAGDQRRAWMEQLADAVAHAFFCRLLCQPGSTDVHLVGRASHRAMAEYVLVTLARDCLEACDREGWALIKAIRRGEQPKGSNRGFAASFRNAYVRTVANRLRAQRSAEMEAARAAGSDGKALVRLDNAYQAVERWTKENMKLGRAGAVSGQTGGNSAGLQAGVQAGQRANLRANGLGAAGRGPGLLGAGR